MSQATFAKGTQLKSDSDTPGTFTLIPEVRSITGPSMTADILDATSMDTPGGFRDKRQGLKDWGTVAFELLWIPDNAQHQKLFDDYSASPGVERAYQIIFPNAASTTFEFTGFVSQMPITAAFDQLLTMNVEITILGDPAPTLS